MRLTNLTNFLTKYQALYPDFDIDIKVSSDDFGEPEIKIQFPESFLAEIITNLIKPLLGKLAPINISALVALFDLYQLNIDKPEELEEILRKELDIESHKLIKLVLSSFMPDIAKPDIIQYLTSHLYWLGKACHGLPKSTKYKLYWPIPNSQQADNDNTIFQIKPIKAINEEKNEIPTEL
ncbi:MAG: hypothetical protein M0P71_07440 [Melioribacteraceae bacterium]|jgi:hypothetical protein|nr:hypothetical protein [Melioribacteraceae bacterium]MDD3982813.1 hypothetical protein [Candidatus Omnitrophota bacterium]